MFWKKFCRNFFVDKRDPIWSRVRHQSENPEAILLAAVNWEMFQRLLRDGAANRIASGFSDWWRNMDQIGSRLSTKKLRQNFFQYNVLNEQIYVFSNTFHC
jgi:hypothetical protein